MAKRIVLFLVVNFLVVITVSLLLNILGVRPYLTHSGIDYRSLLLFCLVWGMSGAFISLGLSRVMAKMVMGVQLIDSSTRDPGAQRLLGVVGRLTRSAGLPMPQVGIYDSGDPNAFATGPTRSRALAALKRTVEGEPSAEEAHPAIAALRISSSTKFMRLFASHPPLDERIARLRAAA